MLLGPRADALANALRYVAQPPGQAPLAPVVAIPLGRLSGHTPLGEAVDACYEKGVIVVAACGQLVGRITYPARYLRCIGAGGLERRGSPLELAPYWPYEDSQDGYARVDVWAPAKGLRRGHCAPRHPGGPHDGAARGRLKLSRREAA